MIAFLLRGRAVEQEFSIDQTIIPVILLVKSVAMYIVFVGKTGWYASFKHWHVQGMGRLRELPYLAIKSCVKKKSVAVVMYHVVQSLQKQKVLLKV